MKTFLRFLLVLLVLVVVGGFLGLRYAGSLVEAAVEKGGTHVLGVETELDGASVGVFSGELGLSGLSVANPPGFEREHFLGLEKAAMQVSLGSLTGERVEAPLLLLEGVSLDLERSGDSSNYGTILDHLEKMGGEAENEPPSEEKDGTSKRFVIRQVVLRDISAHVKLSALGQDFAQTVTLPELTLDNVGNDEQSLRSLVSQIVTKVLEAAVANLDGIVPAELLGDLRGKVADLQALGADLQAEAQEKIDDALQQAQGRVDEAVQQAQGELEKAKQQATGEVQGALDKGKQELEKGLGGLLGGKKKDGDG